MNTTDPLTNEQLRAAPVPVDVGGATINIEGDVTVSNEVEIKNDANSPVPASVASLPLPTGAATSANQTTANSSLSSIDGKLPALSNGRVPVDVGTSVEISNDAGNPVPVSGPLTDTQLRATAVSVAPTVQQGGGAITSTTTRVTLATDGPGVSALSSIDTKTPALVTGRVPVDGSAVAQPVISYQTVVSASFTRPADTTQYAALDAVSDSTSAPTILEFANAARISGGSGLILSARHIKNSTATTNASFRLWIYRSTAAAVNDNSQFPLLWANRANRIGFIDFTHTTQGTGSDSTSSMVTFVNLPFVAAGTSLFGLLTATAAYTPASGEQHYLELSIAQN